jgi:hypothetical protein
MLAFSRLIAPVTYSGEHEIVHVVLSLGCCAISHLTTCEHADNILCSP